MSKTVALRTLIVEILKEVGCVVYYENATKGAQFPYIVYSFDSFNYEYDSRDDVFLLVDVWDKNKTSSKVEELTDTVEKVLGYTNRPNSDTLATFFKESRMSVEDEDELIHHRQVRVKIENYYVGA